MKSVILDNAKKLAISVLNICDNINADRSRAVLVNQVIRSATSIGANVSEAIYAVSPADFINKLHIALKECYETEYWLELLASVGCIDQNTFNSISHDCGTIRLQLIKSINKSKESN